ncbi:MAG: GNAT family N-acetyltransferase [Bacilli bacterium]|nr:GNAT family N-acetyltransferase [Bacilli bacterium]
MYFKKLESERIYLSPMSLEDVNDYTKWMNDRKVTDNIHSTSKVITTIGEKEWVEKLMQRGGHTFAIVSKDNDKLIGNCGLMDTDYKDGTSTIGIFIGEEEYRGKGLGTEVINLLLDYGFNNLRLHNINLGVFSFNERAISCYKKLGFKEYGRRHECYYLDGKWHDEIWMEILEDEYRKNKLDQV